MPESKMVASDDLKSAQEDGTQEDFLWYQRFYIDLLLLFSQIGLTLWFLFGHQCVTLSMARQIRAVIFRDETWHWWQFGFNTWFMLNLAMLTYDKKKHSLASTLKSGERAIKAIYNARKCFSRDQDFHQLFLLWNEFQIRDEGSFHLRNRQFFMDRMGSLFSDPIRIFLRVAMTLSPYDYLILRYLCSKAIRYARERFRLIGPFERAFVDYFTENEEACRLYIKNFKPTILTMAHHYVENMIHFCLETEGLKGAAHVWVAAGRHIRNLQELEVTEANKPIIVAHLEGFFKFADMACTPVFATYTSWNDHAIEVETIETFEAQPPTNPENFPDDKPTQQPILKPTDAWTAFYGRTIHWFQISRDGYTIYDTTVKDEHGAYRYQYSGITEKAHIVRDGLAFFFSDFEKNCKAHQDADGDWVIDQKNDFIKMPTGQEMRYFTNSLKAMPGMQNFIPDVLSPQGTKKRSDGRANNRTGKYRIDPKPTYSSEDNG